MALAGLMRPASRRICIHVSWSNASVRPASRRANALNRSRTRVIIRRGDCLDTRGNSSALDFNHSRPRCASGGSACGTGPRLSAIFLTISAETFGRKVT